MTSDFGRRGLPGTLAFGVALLIALAPHAALAQKLGQGGDDGISYWRVLGALLLCLALAAAGAWAIRSRMGAGPLTVRPILPRFGKQERRLQLVESLRISHQVDLCIVTCDERELLVATSGQRAQLLERLNTIGVRPAGPEAE